MKRAFTLIELLVVIAIIAILAAILFPVFAQAKTAAKKSTSISNLKNIGTAGQMYMADYDDLWVLTYGIDVLGTGYTWNRLIPTPATWPTGLTPEVRAAIEAHFSNNLIPYMKNLDILGCPGTGGYATSGSYVPTVQPDNLKKISYTYNGLLSSYSGSGVAAPSSLIAFWNGRGKGGLNGVAYATPWLTCNDANSPCVYQPVISTLPVGQCAPTPQNTNGYSSSIARTSFNQGFDVFNGGLNVAFADSSVKWRKIGVNGSSTANTDPRRDIFARYNGTVPTHRYWEEKFCHVYLFRPDFDFATFGPAYLFQ